MTEAISDTGPIRHLAEITQLDSLHVFEHILIPDLVAAELDVALIDIKPFREENWLTVTQVPVTDIRRVFPSLRTILPCGVFWSVIRQTSLVQLGF